MPRHRRFTRSISTHLVLTPFIILIFLGPFSLGQTKPKFAIAVDYPLAGCLSDALAIADLNGDSFQDLVVVTPASDSNCVSTVADGTISILLGNGDGTFQSAINLDSGGIFPTSVAVADLNSDGHPDIVVLHCVQSGEIPCSVPNSESEVAVLLGNGNGTFQAPITFSSGGCQITDGSLAIGDFNGDGHLDLAVSAVKLAPNCVFAPDGGVNVLLGNGDGTFQAPLNFDAGEVAANSVSVGDLNGDGKLDLVATLCVGGSNCVSAVGVLLGNGDGTFRNIVTYDTGQYSVHSVAIADVNGDHYADLVVSNRCGTYSTSCYQGSLTVLLGNGDGTFQAPVEYKSNGYYNLATAIVDLNLDGAPDLASINFGINKSNITSGVDILLGVGDGTFEAPVRYPSGNLGGYKTTAVGVGDFNRDGEPDIALIHECTVPGCGAVATVLLNATVFTTTMSVTSSLNPSLFGQSVNFTATISSKPVVPDGTIVTFYDGSTQIGTGSTVSGRAAFTTALSKSGNHTIKAMYAGSSIFKTSSGSVVQVVNKYSTTTTLTTSVNPSSYGQTVTFTATVTSTGPYQPTGTVKFSGIGSAKLSGGIATFSTKTLNPGTYPVIAQFQGDTASAPSSSPEVDQVVNPASTVTTLTSSLNPSTQGQTVKFTAVVTSSTGVPATGTVTFTAGTTSLGSVSLSSSKASVSTNSLPVGTATVQATYSGTTQFTGSSASLNQTVNP